VTSVAQSTSGEPAFRRVLLVHTEEEPQRDLLEYTALLASMTVAGDAVVAAYPSNAMLRELTPAALRPFEERRLPRPCVGLLAEPDIDGVLEAARDYQPDLMVMRHPLAYEASREVAKRILAEAPCSVCFVPSGAAPRLRRVVAGLELDAAGRALLDQAVQLCYAAHSAELIGVHACAREMKSDRLEELKRLLGRVDVRGLSCTPLMEDDSAPQRALARVAAARQADLVVVGRKPGAAPRVAYSLLWDCQVPVVQMLLRMAASGVRGFLRRVFSNPEPQFN
jgi:nucleotide-binding universal stress UspA family protein